MWWFLFFSSYFKKKVWFRIYVACCLVWSKIQAMLFKWSFIYRYKFCKQKDSVPLEKVHLFWVCPDTNAFEWFKELLLNLEREMRQKNSPDFLKYNIYLTRGWDANQVWIFVEVFFWVFFFFSVFAFSPPFWKYHMMFSENNNCEWMSAL